MTVITQDANETEVLLTGGVQEQFTRYKDHQYGFSKFFSKRETHVALVVTWSCDRTIWAVAAAS